MPCVAARLVQIISGGKASAAEIERVATADPVLCARLLRSASLGAKNAAGVTTIRSAVMRLGQTAVPNMALSICVQDMLVDQESPCQLDLARFSHHGLFVGMLARYVFARRLAQGEARSMLSAEEFFSAGMLHDLAIGALARAAPSTFDDL
jgi:Predicted signal transduction protein